MLSLAIHSSGIEPESIYNEHMIFIWKAGRSPLSINMVTILSREEAKLIYEMSKTAPDAVQWIPDDASKSHQLTIEIIAEDGTILKIRGWYKTKGPRKYGFSLIFHNNIVLRRWDDTPGHKHPISGIRTKGPHKHYYDPDYGDSLEYETDEICPNDVNRAIMDFLKECRVTLEKRYQALIEGNP